MDIQFFSDTGKNFGGAIPDDGTIPGHDGGRGFTVVAPFPETSFVFLLSIRGFVDGMGSDDGEAYAKAQWESARQSLADPLKTQAFDMSLALPAETSLHLSLPPNLATSWGKAKL
jgi:hypothetical protein